MIVEIGALVGIVKALLDAGKTGRDLFGGISSSKANALAVTKVQERIAGLAEQLLQSLALAKLLPIWLKEQSATDLFAEELSDGAVKVLDARIRQLISDSIHDHFSGTFFRTNFELLPGVDSGIKAFRDRLLALEGQLNGIPAGDATAWRRAWPIVRQRMQDLRLEAVKLANLADELHASLVRELKDAASVA